VAFCGVFVAKALPSMLWPRYAQLRQQLMRRLWLAQHLDNGIQPFEGDNPMNEPVYRFFRGRFTDAWYQLSQSEQDKVFAEMGNAFQESNGKAVVGPCLTCWSSDWHVFGVEVYPSLEAVQTWRETMARLNCFRYFELESMIGVQQAS
jgi:hypothetical protein